MLSGSFQTTDLQYLKHKEKSNGNKQAKSKQTASYSQFLNPGQLSQLHENRCRAERVSRLPYSRLPIGVNLMWNSVLSPYLPGSMESFKAAIH